MSLSVQTFEKLIVEGRIYVDKTQNIYDLITSDLQVCFFSCPRRFGKSLTVTTLESIFLENDFPDGLSIVDWDLVQL